MKGAYTRWAWEGLLASKNTNRQSNFSTDLVRRRKGLTIVALQNFAGGRQQPAQAPPGARCAIDLVYPVDQAYVCVWQDLLRDALVFDSEDLMSHYKAQYGYGRMLAARRGGGGWRVVRSKWEVRWRFRLKHSRDESYETFENVRGG